VTTQNTVTIARRIPNTRANKAQDAYDSAEIGTMMALKTIKYATFTRKLSSGAMCLRVIDFPTASKWHSTCVPLIINYELPSANCEVNRLKHELLPIGESGSHFYSAFVNVSEAELMQ
jgi:hypothetical protein